MAATETGALSARRDGDQHGEPQFEPSGRASIGGAALAEGIGTFILLFFGIGAILAAGGADDPAQKLVIGLGFGLALLAIAYTFGHVSGAHVNPAITAGLVASGRFPAMAGLVYVVAQILGAIFGVIAADLVFAEGSIAGTATVPGDGVGVGAALFAEAILGFILMLVVKGTAVDDRAEGPAAGLAIGLTVAAGHLAMIPVSGSSFNPARSIGSAVVGGEWGDLWIYLVGPTIGAVAAALLYERLLRRVDVPDVDD